MKVLILTPYFDKPGGVAVYFSSLKKVMGNNYEFFFRGNKSTIRSPKVIFQYILDYSKFLIHLINNQYDVFLINTSFAATGCKRDQVYINILKLLDKKMVVFFHGWDKEYEIKTDKYKQSNAYPLKSFKKVDSMVVLASEFKEKLVSWGFNQKIYIETTVVDSFLTDGLISRKIWNEHTNFPIVFLFMARIEKEKGIFEAVNLFRELQNQLPNKQLQFKIAGSGSALDSLKDYVQSEMITNIEFLGHISGKEKKDAFLSSHVFLFPSMHGEGMPICLLEAMAFGLPLVTSIVGGVKDFFIEGKMGISINPFEALSTETVGKIQDLLSNLDAIQEISDYNFQFAKENFYAKEVAKRLEDILKETI
ncbi:glycosyltransferase family 4 protein [Aquiflexum gelatinilyticum]|uniref:Glycosyltransferase family 4 protein n=1 Tax=Aquiflexum gelatinilyticum TaxID=2961943 RepID=A0A9X2P3Q7_9BACT|nr:glycosyltransferase family 4 protein [Aquiflexum gelatinilyticum]MCR9014617.1 glycosyltransferase family 4 protein [Aquiflexum gelatinilyticum]